MELRLRSLRKENGISQAELAKTLGVDIKTVGNWERGKTVPDSEQVWNCAVALGSTPNDVMGWYDEHPEDRPASPPADPMASDLVDAYGRCTPERRAALVQSARDAALASGEVPERGGVRHEGVA